MKTEPKKTTTMDRLRLKLNEAIQKKERIAWEYQFGTNMVDLEIDRIKELMEKEKQRNSLKIEYISGMNREIQIKLEN